jgi:glycosyltransferase involved in cell wall biosynthesis
MTNAGTQVPSGIVLNFVQDVPTPHNNALLRALQSVEGHGLRAWYRQSSLSDYGFSADLASEVVAPHYYGSLSSSIRMLFEAMTQRSSHWFLVHWSNPTTKAFLVLSWATRRPFNIWFDMPAEPASGRRLRREVAQWFLRRSRARVFCVGELARQYFIERGFPLEALVNLPVVVEPREPVEVDDEWRSAFRSQRGLPPDCFLIATGSRLTREKGFDVLVSAVAALEQDVRDNVYAVIVGKGDESDSLIAQAAALGVGDHVQVWPWLEASEFRALFAAADVIVHPSRLDAYGGPALLALAERRPLIGTFQAGGSVDIVEEGVNGHLYDADDVDALAGLIEGLARDPRRTEDLGAGMARLSRSAERTPKGAATLLMGKLV